MQDVTRIGLVLSILILSPGLLPAAGCGKGDPAPDSGDAATSEVATPSAPAAGAGSNSVPSAAPAKGLSASLTAAVAKIPEADRARALPEGTDGAAGKAVFDAQCTNCHGATGKGDGVAAGFLDPGPGDWTSGAREAQTSPGEKEWLIANGVGGGSAMPGFSATLTEEQRWQVVAYLNSLKK